MYDEPWRSAYWRRAKQEIDSMRAWLRLAKESDVQRTADIVADHAGATGDTRKLILVVLLERWREARARHRGEVAKGR